MRLEDGSGQEVVPAPGGAEVSGAGQQDERREGRGGGFKGGTRVCLEEGQETQRMVLWKIPEHASLSGTQRAAKR